MLDGFRTGGVAAGQISDALASAWAHVQQRDGRPRLQLAHPGDNTERSVRDPVATTVG